jgi:hypothetical protein
MEKFNNIGSAEKINKKMYHCSNFFLSETEIQGLLDPAQASVGYFLAWLQSLRSSSTQSETPLALIPLAPKSHVSFKKLCTQM